MESNDTDDTPPQSGVDTYERQRGEELRQWQMQERAERLKPLSAILSELARRLLMIHCDWEAQEQMHLDYIRLEARARPEAEIVLVDCRWAEDVIWPEYGVVEVSLARFDRFQVISIGTPEIFEEDPGWPSHVMALLVQEVEQEIVSQALIAPEGVTSLVPWFIQ